MKTRIETIPGIGKPSLNAIKIDDLPFPKSNLTLWIDAKDSIIQESTQAPGVFYIDSFTDKHDQSTYVRLNRPNLDVSIVNGITVGVPASQLEDSTKIGYDLPIDLWSNKSAITAFGTCKLSDEELITNSESLYGSYTSDEVAMLTFLRSVAGDTPNNFRVSARKSREDSATVLEVSLPVDTWFSWIIEIDYVNNTLTLEVIDVEVKIGVLSTNTVGNSENATDFGAVLCNKSGDNSAPIANQMWHGGVSITGFMDGIQDEVTKSLLIKYLQSRKNRLNA